MSSPADGGAQRDMPGSGSGGRLPGDFYRDDNDAVRGVSLSPAAPGEHYAAKGSVFGSSGYHFREPDDMLKGVSLDPSGGFRVPQLGFDSGGFHPEGDHYRDEKLVTRGVSLAPSDLFSYQGADGFSKEDMGLMGLLKPSVGGLAVDQRSGLEFGDEDQPPQVPAWPYKLVATTVKVSTSRPCDVGNCLLSFLREVCNADLLKPVPSKPGKTKYSIKALVFVQNVSVTMKIKVFEDPPEVPSNAPPVYAVEFQRRSGDALAFHNTYQSAAKFLEDSGNVVMVEAPQGPSTHTAGPAPVLVPPELGVVDIEDDDLPPPPPPPPLGTGGPQPALGPLLDMAMAEGHPALQAEGASALAGLAEHPGRVSALCTQSVLTALDKLLEVDEITVAYPAVKALRLLAAVAPAAQSLAQQKEERLRALSASSCLVCKEFDGLVCWMGKAKQCAGKLGAF